MLNAHSQQILDHVAAPLQLLIHVASELSSCPPFILLQGVRSAEEQLKDWLTGHSKLNGIPIGTIQHGYKGTGLSAHQQGRAVDFMPVGHGDQVDWNWNDYYPIVRVIQRVAIIQKCVCVWGGVWDKPLNGLSPDIEHEHKEYIFRALKRGIRHPLCDGPHIELHEGVK